MRSMRSTRSVWMLCCVVVGAAAGIGRAQHILTGSQATYLHRIQLFDENKQLITPESKVPYSTKNTCGKCHDYNAISHGWHFQAGLYEKNETDSADIPADKRPGEPFFVTEPISRTQIPVSYRDWAKQTGLTPDAVGLKPFDFALGFASHHPGGGMLEFSKLDDDGKPVRHKGGDWDKTGVLEIDCLMCHLRHNYSAETRGLQIDYKNFKWAATAAAGLGNVKGEAGSAQQAAAADFDPMDLSAAAAAATSGPSVEVIYDAGKFDQGNYVTLDVTRHVPNSNCLFCHYTRQRETPEDVSHHRIRDIHFAAGLLCTDCHKNDIHHRITRGNGSAADLARSPDNATLTCQGCHYEGRACAPKDDHPGLPAFHLQEITCTACHSGFEAGDVVAGQLTAIAHKLGLSTEKDIPGRLPRMYGPIWKRSITDDKIRLYRYVYPRWYGTKGDKGITALPIDAVTKAVKSAADAVKDDNEDGEKEVDTDAEIAAVLKALASAAGEKAKPVLVGRGGVYELEGEDKVTWTPHSIGEPYSWPLAHPVKPRGESLGSGGCTDCHDAHEPFYMIKTLVDDDTQPEPPIRSYNLLGTTEGLVKLGEFREEFVKTTLVWLIPIVAGLCLLHYVTFGPKQVAQTEAKADVRRFDGLERWMHLFLFLAFLALFATGLGFLTNKLPFARGNFWTSSWALELHEIAGLIFAGATVVVTLRWFVTSIPARYDWEWVKSFGGYLWIKAHPPAGKFNFGQKMFFWGAMILAILLSVTGITMWLTPGGDEGWATIAYTIHDLAAVLLMAFAVVHLYLSTIANPGTLRAIFSGLVTRPWARDHHPNWAEEKLGPAEEESH